VLRSKLKGYNTQGFGYAGEDAYFYGKARFVAGDRLPSMMAVMLRF